jgi:CRP-like cAMP-binding protein
MPAESSHPLDPMLKKLAYYAPLDDADFEALRALPYQLKTVDARQDIVREGERPTFCCVILSGFAFRYKLVAGGARQIVSIHMTSDLVDLENSLLGVADHSVEMMVRSEVAMIPREAVLALAFERPKVGFAMWYSTLVDGSVFREWIANVGRRDAKTAMAHLFCELALLMKVAGVGGQNDYEMPLTQEQLADCLGLTPVHVNRTIKLLESDKLINRSTSRSITIGNWEKLAEAGGFDSTYMHLKGNDTVFA